MKRTTPFEFILIVIIVVTMVMCLALFANTLWHILGNDSTPPQATLQITKVQYDNFSIDIINGVVWAMGINANYPDYDNIGCDYIYPDINDGPNNCGIVDRGIVKSILEDNNIQYGVSTDLKRNY